MNRSRVVGGRYLLLAELDRGGFGRSYQAEDRITGRQVAVIEIRLPAASGEGADPLRDRLLREVRASGRIRHRNGRDGSGSRESALSTGSGMLCSSTGK